MNELFRIPNGSRVTIGDWVGIVVDQRGPTVLVTVPSGIAEIPRDRIVGGVAT